MIDELDLTDWSNYWRAALARHKAYIAAGCLSPVGAIRVSAGPKRAEEDETPEEKDDV